MGMTRSEYIAAIIQRGYRQVNDSQVACGTLVFDVTEVTNHTAMGEQTGFCLRLNADSDLNLCPNPYQK